ncbi:MAG TPA: Ig-like domain repeat protein, partial [Candidatus Angelobacter sp.]
TVSLSGGTLASSGSCTFSVGVTGISAGAQVNTTGNVTSTEGGTGGTASDTLTVSPATTSTAVSSSANPSIFGQSITFTATVTDTSAGSTAQPTGSVQFVVDGVNFGSPVAVTGASSTSSTATSQATATLSVSGSPHTVTANYTNADGNFINSSGSLTGGQTITLATTNTAVVSSSNPSVFGQSVTFTATVVDISAGSTAQPTGAVQFVVDGVNFGSPVTLTGASSNSSTATSQATTTLSIGGSPHSVTANYVNADGNFTNSTGSLAGGQVVTQAGATTTVSSSLGTITLGDTETFTATVTANPPASGTPTGTVIFFDGSRPIGGGKLSGGQATFPTAVLAVGSHSITAIYNGDANFAASPLSSPITETVNLRGSTTSLGLNPTTVGAGQASTTTVTVTDGGASTPPGTPDVFSATGAPATGRTGFTATLIANGAVVVTGGTDANNIVLASAEVYSGGTFSPTPGNLNAARTGAAAVLLANGKVLIVGGSSNGSANGALNSAELLDLKTGTFALTSQHMTAARFGMTASLLNNGKVLIAGGENSGGVVNSAELYDPAADTFTATGNLNHGRTGASATLLATGKVLVAGGSSNGDGTGALNTAEVFDPAGNAGAGTFTSVAGANPSLAAGRWQPEAALLLSGKVLVAGGQDSSGALTTADLYDPVADSFTASGHPMNEARANGSAVALPSGMVLLAGGTTSQNVDLYDADGDKFNLTGTLLHHDSPVSTLLNNGQVLVIGLNSDNPPPFVSDAELYSPSFNPLGTVGFSSSEPTDVFGAPCVLTPSTSTASTCTSMVTPIQVATSPHTITGTYPADAVHSGSSNSASLTVIPTAPPTIAKAFSALNVAQNGKVNVSFTIVNHNSAATLTGISFTDALPAGLVVASPNNLASNCGGTFTAVPGSSAMSLTGGTVAPPGTPPAIGQCVITVDLLVTGTGTITNQTGPVSANESGPGFASNIASIHVVLAPTVNKAFGAASIPLNGTTSLTFNLANPNTATTLVGIALSDTLPSGLVVATPNGLAGTCVASSIIGATPGSNSISLSSLNLAASSSCSFSVNVTGTSAGAKNNTSGNITGTFDDGSGTFVVITGGTASASIAVVAPPVIAKAFAPAAIAPTGISTLSFTITNPAANTLPENGVAFTDMLPANVVVATPNGATGNCNGGTLTAGAGSGIITLTGGTVPVGSSCVVSVNVTSSVIGSYTNTTGAVSSTNGGTGNTASATLTVGNASLSITKTHVGNFPRNSTGNNYTITVSNANAGPTVGTVTVTDTLPNVNNTLIATGLTGTGWTCNLGTLTCTRSDSLAPGASYPPITLTVTVPQNIRANVTNSATVSGGGDPNSHTANDPTHIGPPIQITLDVNSVTVNVGGTQFINMTVDSSPGEGTINFACSGLPFGASCSFNPPSTNQLNATVTMGITTSAGTTGALLPLDPGTAPPLYTAMLPLLGLLGLAVGRKRGKAVRLRVGLLFASMALLLVLVGCGGGGRTVLPTPAGTSTITVTATSATTGDSATATITLTVP